MAGKLLRAWAVVRVMNQENSQDGKPPSLLGVFRSVLASMFGVQSSRQHKTDFTSGKPWQFIIVGLVMTAIFVLAVWAVVTLVMNLSGL